MRRASTASAICASSCMIKLPLILPTIGLVSILTFVANFNAFDLIYSREGRARRAEFRHRHPRHLLLPHLLRQPAAARRSDHGRDDRDHDVLHHPDRRAASISSSSSAACSATHSEGVEHAPHAPRRSVSASMPSCIAYTLLALAADPAGHHEFVQDAQRDLRLAAGAADAETFSLIGYAKVLGATRMSALYFAQLHDRHARSAWSRAAVRRHGRLGAHRIQVPRQHAARRSIWRSASWCRSASARSPSCSMMREAGPRSTR